MSDFDRLIRNLARAGTLAARARQGDRQVIDELIDSLQKYAETSAETYEGEATHAQEPEHERPEAAARTTGIDRTIAEYRATKEAMAEIVDRHMRAAFAEIEARYGTTPTDVTLDITEQPPGDTYPKGRYLGSKVRLGGE
ncbi:MAG: hypothetical protein UMU75_01275 [Halomonas sp.]|nr:hypothetical protein [Halomonas sp.]